MPLSSTQRDGEGNNNRLFPWLMPLKKVEGPLPPSVGTHSQESIRAAGRSREAASLSCYEFATVNLGFVCSLEREIPTSLKPLLSVPGFQLLTLLLAGPWGSNQATAFCSHPLSLAMLGLCRGLSRPVSAMPVQGPEGTA